jgi:hypothetical protein
MGVNGNAVAVLVACTGVLEGKTAVLLGITEVADGGTAVLVGATGVLVAEGCGVAVVTLQPVTVTVTGFVGM